MNELETAIEEARKLEDRVKDLYSRAVRCDSGLVTLKLLFPNIKLPEEGVSKYKGELAAAIANAATSGSGNTEWCVWLKRKKGRGGNFNFRFKWFDNHLIPKWKKIPSMWGHTNYFLYSNIDELPF